MLGNIIGGFIVIIVGATLAPTIATEVEGALINGSGNKYGTGVNITGSEATVLELTTLFYCLAVAGVGIGMTVVGLRNAGLM
jgi:hypothetical protein